MNYKVCYLKMRDAILRESLRVTVSTVTRYLDDLLIVPQHNVWWMHQSFIDATEWMTTGTSHTWPIPLITLFCQVHYVETRISELPMKKIESPSMDDPQVSPIKLNVGGWRIWRRCNVLKKAAITLPFMQWAVTASPECSSIDRGVRVLMIQLAILSVAGCSVSKSPLPCKEHLLLLLDRR